MNKKWRDALLAAARNLRQNMLKGRIWGGAESPNGSPSPPSASPPSKVFSSAQYNSSSSSIESTSSLSAGDDDADAEPGMAGTSLGRSKARRYRNGRVRGMVETFERSGSFSSDGGLDGPEGNTEGNAADERTKFRTWSRQEAQLTGQSVMRSPSPSPSPSPSRRRPLPVPPSPGSSNTGSIVDEEPTMEALLARLEKGQPHLARTHPVTGAEAWEAADLAAGVTVKRVPDAPQPSFSPESHFGTRVLTGLGSGHSSGGSSKGKGKGDRRVVTAIFAPAPDASGALKALETTAGLSAFASPPASPDSRPLPQPPQSRPESPSKGRPLPPTPGVGAGAAEGGAGPAIGDEGALQLERMLEEEILATRALLETFRTRLEAVEEKVADLEALEIVRAHEDLARAEVEALNRVGAETVHEEAEKESVEVGVQFARELSDAGVCASEAGPAVPLELDPAPTTISSVSSSLQSVIPEVVRRLHAPAELFAPGAWKDTKDKARGKDGAEEDEGAPATVSDLPSYVFLVGLGVCAVVVQVVLRKVVARGGWRP